MADRLVAEELRKNDPNKDFQSAERITEKYDHNQELQAAQQITTSIDLISAAKHLLGFLKIVSGLPHLYGGASAASAIRRYHDFWMPLVTERDLLNEKDLVPPLDIQWVWLCHCLRQKAHQHNCKTRDFKLLQAPVFGDSSSQSAAQEQCRQVWNESYPDEPFDLEFTQKFGQSNRRNQTSHSSRPSQCEEKELMESMSKQIAFYNQVSQQYMHHDDFLMVAKERYLCFLHMLDKTKGRAVCVPTYDILLMMKTHQTCPTAYVHDMERLIENMDDNDSVVCHQLSNGIADGFEQTSRTWAMLFGLPYERAGAVWPELNLVDRITPPEEQETIPPVTINWHQQNFDINSKHTFLQPRHVLEVCVHVKSAFCTESMQETADDLFLGVRTIESCKKFKHRISAKGHTHDTVWHKVTSMQCDVSTKGLIFDLTCYTLKCFETPFFSTLLGQVTISWKELEKAALLTIEKNFTMKSASQGSSPWTILASITPPVQAPYLFKALLDQVTDDDGAMISKRMMRCNKYKPQEGRWMSRTVLNHAGEECFIIRIRVATGVWRSKTETPVGVDWNERVVRIHGGGWKYISGSKGIAPEEILATATPLNDELEQYKMKWSFSTGETLTIQMPIEDLEWERHLRFSLKGNRLGVVRLINGRHMQYAIPSAVPEEEEGFVTLVRYTAEARQGRATALFNWKMSALEVLPEEDVVLVMLLCTATQRGIADLGGKSLRNFYRKKGIRKREKQRNWGSVVMGAGEETPSERMFWYANPEEVLGANLAEMENEEVLPKGASEQMYRGTSWLYAGSSKGLYKMTSKGSLESFGIDIGEYRTSSLPQFGSLTKVATSSR